MKNHIYRSFTIGIFVLSAASQASAQDSWDFQVTPYAWLSGVSGSVGSSGLPSADIDLSFSDVLDDLDYAGMLAGSARNGPWVVYFDTTLSKTTSTAPGIATPSNTVTLESKINTLSFAVGKTVSESAEHRVDAFVGARAWWLDNRATVTTTGGGGPFQANTDTSWVDPIIGIAGNYVIDDRWSLFGSADIGGFDVGSRFSLNIFAGARYALTDTADLAFGWRHLSVDYSDSQTVYDVDQTGPVFGATFKF